MNFNLDLFFHLKHNYWTCLHLSYISLLNDETMDTQPYLVVKRKHELFINLVTGTLCKGCIFIDICPCHDYRSVLQLIRIRALSSMYIKTNFFCI